VTKEAYIVDPVLDYDPFGPSINTLSASNIIKFIEQHELNVTRIIETHVHAVIKKKKKKKTIIKKIKYFYVIGSLIFCFLFKANFTYKSIGILFIYFLY
jgi:hypothetical protein